MPVIRPGLACLFARQLPQFSWVMCGRSSLVIENTVAVAACLKHLSWLLITPVAAYKASSNWVLWAP